MSPGRFLFLFVILIFCQAVQSQTSKIDTMISWLKNDLPDSTRANYLRQLATYYETVDEKKSAQAYREAIDFAKQKKLNFEAGTAYNEYQFLLQAQGKYNDALLSLDSALIYLGKSTDERAPGAKGRVYGALSVIYKFLNDYGKAIEYQLLQNNVYEKLSVSSSLTTAYVNTSLLYKELRDLDKQEEYARKALSTAQQIKSDKDIFLAYDFIAYALSEQLKYDEAAKYLDSAKLYYREDLPLDPTRLISYHLISGSIYAKLKRYEDSYKEFSAAYDNAQASKNTFSKYQSLMQMGNIRRFQKRYEDAEKILLEADAGIQQTGELSQKNVLLSYLSDLYKDWGKYEKALNYYKMYIGASDSISNIQNQEIAADLEKKYETEK